MRPVQTEQDKAAQLRKERLGKYFRRTPSRNRNLLIILGVVASTIAIMISFAAISNSAGLFGLVLLAASGYGAFKSVSAKLAYNKEYRAAEPKPSDVEMDRVLASDLANIEERARKMLGVTFDDLELVDSEYDPIASLDRGNPHLNRGDRRPLLLFGPQKPFDAAFGLDDVLRFSRYQIMAIYPTSYHFAIYLGVIDFLTGGIFQEETQEYMYNDVVAVTIKSEPGAEFGSELLRRKAGKDEGKNDNTFRFEKSMTRDFQIIVASGHSAGVVVGIVNRDDESEVPLQLHDHGIDDVIKAVRRMLREKKGGVRKSD